jgi:hypothetical protein
MRDFSVKPEQRSISFCIVAFQRLISSSMKMAKESVFRLLLASHTLNPLIHRLNLIPSLHQFLSIPVRRDSKRMFFVTAWRYSFRVLLKVGRIRQMAALLSHSSVLSFTPELL